MKSYVLSRTIILFFCTQMGAMEQKHIERRTASDEFFHYYGSKALKKKQYGEFLFYCNVYPKLYQLTDKDLINNAYAYALLKRNNPHSIS